MFKSCSFYIHQGEKWERYLILHLPNAYFWLLEGSYIPGQIVYTVHTILLLISQPNQIGLEVSIQPEFLSLQYENYAALGKNEVVS